MTTEVHLPAVVEQDWLRLHRRSIWVAPLKPLAGILVTGVLVITFRGWETFGIVEPLIGLAVALAGFLLSAWRWATTRYRITGTHVEMQSGMVVRRHRAVARDRLRSVDLTAEIMHRLAGLAVVVIGTGRQGGDADDELTLDSVGRPEAERLREMLLIRRTRPAEAADTAPADARAGAVVVPDADAVGTSRMVATFERSWLRLAPFSLLGLVAVALLLAGAAQLARTVGGNEVFTWETARATWAWVTSLPPVPTVLGGLLVIVVLNALLSTVLYVLLYGGYTLHHAPDGTLRIAYGLVTHRSVAIEERRIRGVRMDEPLLLRLPGGARLRLVAAGLGAREKDGEKKEDSDLLLPTAPRAVADQVTADVLGVTSAPAAEGVHRHPPAALRVLLVRWMTPALVPAAGLGVLAAVGLAPNGIWPWLLVLLVPAVLFAWLEFRNLGHRLAEGFLVTRGGSAVRHTVTVRCDGIIAWRLHRTVFQSRSGLLSVTAAIAAGKGAHTIQYAREQDGLELAKAAVPGLLEPFLERE